MVALQPRCLTLYTAQSRVKGTVYINAFECRGFELRFDSGDRLPMLRFSWFSPILSGKLQEENLSILPQVPPNSTRWRSG